MTDTAGIHAPRLDNDDEKAQNRRSAVDALWSAMSGIGVSMAYPAFRDGRREPHPMPAGVALGFVAMVIADIPTS